MKQRVLGLLLALCTLPAAAENRFSLEGLLGTADQKTSHKIEGEEWSTSGDDLSVGIRGAFNLNKYLAFELAYHNYGETNDSYIDDFDDTITDMVKTTAFNAGVKGIIPFDNGISLYGRAGFSFWDIKMRETDSYFPEEDFKGSDDGSDAYFGVGLQYDITSQFFIGAEYTITKMKLSASKILGGYEVEPDLSGKSFDHEVKNLSLSLGYKF